MTLTSKIYALGVVALLLAIYLSIDIVRVGASAPSGLPSTFATSSVYTVGNTAVTLFATSSCAARIITTSASAINLTFSEKTSIVPSGVLGHLQAASTTVAYDSGQYGCGAVQAFGYVSGFVNTTETN